jgi:gluconate 2-dehydrogenase gamma chain
VTGDSKKTEANAHSGPISRRDILRTLMMGAVGSSVLQVIPLQAAEHVHRMIAQEKTLAPGAKYKPKFFSTHQYATLSALCDAIIPADDHSGGAVQAGTPEFIDLLTSENKEYQVTFGGGMMWLDGICADRYGHTYLEAVPAQKTEILDLIAYKNNGIADPRLCPGIEFFAFLRRITSDGFYTSEIGIQDLQYIGNTFLKSFPGCPTPPET